MERGVLYFAQGNTFIEEARISANSFKKYHKNIPIILVSPDAIRRPNEFDDFIQIPDLGNPFKTKVSSLEKSPFEYTLFLDTDIIIQDSVYELFDFLLSYDLVIANRVHCEWYSDRTVFLNYVDNSAYNTGVFCYSNSNSMKTFISKWKSKVIEEDSKRMKSGVFCDQHHFNKLVFEDKYGEEIGLRIVEVPNKKYNARPHLLKQLKTDGQFNEIKILHQHFEVDPKKRAINQLKKLIKKVWIK